jgi:hypothetical protein
VLHVPWAPLTSTLDCMDTPREYYDLRRASFDEFVDFLFDRPVVPIPENINVQPGPWYWSAEVQFDAVKVAAFYIQLFSHPEFLLDRYTTAQLEQGFWAIPSSNIECSVADIIWNKRVPFELRESCIRSMYEVYARLFAKNSLDTSSNMWWDSLAYDWHCGNRVRSNGGEDESMQDVMFETLGRILSLSEVSCQEAALHGLGHLHHPKTKGLIQRFLRENQGISPELKEYALAAARFEVM